MTKHEFLFSLKETLRTISLSEAEIRETEKKIWDNNINDKDKQEVIKIHSAAKAALAEAKEDLWRLFDRLKIEIGKFELKCDEFNNKEELKMFFSLMGEIVSKYGDEYFIRQKNIKKKEVDSQYTEYTEKMSKEGFIMYLRGLAAEIEMHNKVVDKLREEFRLFILKYVDEFEVNDEELQWIRKVMLENKISL